MEETTRPEGAQPTALGAVDPTWVVRSEGRGRGFRVRLMRFDRPQSRTTLVHASSEPEARARAQAEAGHDWRVVGVRAD